MDSTISVEGKALLLEGLVDWGLLEQHLGHHFKHETDPPFRLLIGLLYLKAMNNTSYEETIEQWNSSPLIQKFCGGSQPHSARPMRASTLSIWNRVIGDSGINWMSAAVSVPQQNKSLH